MFYAWSVPWSDEPQRALNFQISELKFGENRSFCRISGIFLEISASEIYFSDSGKWPFHTPQSIPPLSAIRYFSQRHINNRFRNARMEGHQGAGCLLTSFSSAFPHTFWPVGARYSHTCTNHHPGLLICTMVLLQRACLLIGQNLVIKTVVGAFDILLLSRSVNYRKRRERPKCAGKRFDVSSFSSFCGIAWDKPLFFGGWTIFLFLARTICNKCKWIWPLRVHFADHVLLVRHLALLFWTGHM